MATMQEKQMLKEFGFQDHIHLQKSVNIPPRKRYRNYKFKWRLILKEKYTGAGSSVKNDLIKFLTEYEDYVIKNQKGNLSDWPKKAKDQAEYLFDRLVYPWNLIKHGRLLFSVKDPQNNYWFRAMTLNELFEALDICYNESKKTGARIKPWTLSLKWTECVTSYNQKRKRAILWLGKDYDVTLMICDNIISTWSTKTGDWKPWNNSWSKLAHQKLTGIKYGYMTTLKNGGGLIAGITAGLSAYPGLLKRDMRFSDVANFVCNEGLSGMKQAAFILATAFAVGGSNAAKIINGFHEQHGIPKWWEKK
jgi:hypothetical protein